MGVVGELGVRIEIVPPDGLHAAIALRNTMGSAIELRRGSASVSVRLNRYFFIPKEKAPLQPLGVKAARFLAFAFTKIRGAC
ncbi:hypothetical protein GV64_12315 [Endozoicomonas elysicola]|uniref:Uncharacterized protein n=1 Tax=Endozoicomonas elysicola TaxID=305900 RepID=A0A081KB93_9GAMM|nr:hypothetical protein GV64_12315 [Endozoicomonas elysicola]